MDDVKYIDDKVRAAIRTMRKACDDAKRDLQMYENSPTQKPAVVMHCLSYGLANASSDLESAMNQISRMYERIKIEKE